MTSQICWSLIKTLDVKWTIRNKYQYYFKIKLGFPDLHFKLRIAMQRLIKQRLLTRQLKVDESYYRKTSVKLVFQRGTTTF